MKYLIPMLAILLASCENHQQKPEIDRSLTCVPTTPVNWGELFSQDMHATFQEKLNDIWTADEHTNKHMPDVSLEDNIYDQSCKIIRPLFGEPTLGNKSCLPWKITTHDTIDKVIQWRETGKVSHTFEELAGIHWQGKAFDPRTENPFKPEWWNQDMDFAVMMRSGHSTWFYPKDCCKFMTFDEMKQEIIARNKGEWQYDNQAHLYRDFYFRKWHSWVIDDDVGVDNPAEDINFLSYPLNMAFSKDKEHKNHLKKDEFLMYRAFNKCGYRNHFYIDISP